MTKRKLEVTQCEITTTLANLSTAAHALREEPYKRIPYLAGIMTVAGYQVECLRQKTIELRTINAKLLWTCKIANSILLADMPCSSAELKAMDKLSAVIAKSEDQI